jgi:Arc/MetJ-type ribon-helix-helix transcriptional regulator
MGVAVVAGLYYDVIRIHGGCDERMNMGTLTVRLTEREDRDLQWACEQTGKSRSEVVRELLAESLRGYRLRQALQAAHAELGGAARQAGWLTEDDILKDVS